MNPSGGDAPLQPAGLHCEAKAVRNITSVPAIQNCAKVSLASFQHSALGNDAQWDPAEEKQRFLCRQISFLSRRDFITFLHGSPHNAKIFPFSQNPPNRDLLVLG